MHPQASCPRLNHTVNPSQNIRLFYNFASGRWQPRHHVHLLHSRKTDTPKATRHDSKAGAKEQNTAAKRRLENNKDIILHDLSATLQAHRATNRASTIRKINVELDWQPIHFTRPSKFQSSILTNPSASNSIRAQNWILNKVLLQQKAISDTTPDATVTPPGARPATNGTPSIRKVNSNIKMPAYTFLTPSFLDPKEALRLRKIAAASKRVSATPELTITGKSHIPGSRASILQESEKKSPNRMKVRGSRNKASDYEGHNINPLGQWMWSRKRLEETTKSPWISLMTDKDGDGLGRLQKEIQAYRNYTALRPYEMAAFNSLVSVVESMAKKCPDSPSLHLLGSYSVGLATPTSNVDLRLSLLEYERDPLSRGPSASRPESWKAIRKSLDKLCQIFQSSRQFQDVKLVPASMWHLDAVHSSTKLRVNIQANPIQPPSLRLMMTFISEFPTLRSLYFVLYMALRMRGLSAVSSGGLGGYEIFMMIVYVLKHYDSKLPRHDGASQLLHILEFYSDVDLYKNGFSVDPARMFDKSKSGMNCSYAIDNCINMMPLMDVERPYLLCLQDPADPKTNLGGTSYGIKHVQAVFRSARKDIKYAMREWEGMTESERESSQLSCLQPLVGANYHRMEERRNRLKRTMNEQE